MHLALRAGLRWWLTLVRAERECVPVRPWASFGLSEVTSPRAQCFRRVPLLTPLAYIAAAERRELFRFSADLGKLALRIADQYGTSFEKW